MHRESQHSFLFSVSTPTKSHICLLRLSGNNQKKSISTLNIAINHGSFFNGFLSLNNVTKA